MKLLKLSYQDVHAEWGFDDLSFFPDVSLLVGASGVGKTRILRAIWCLRQIANDSNSGSFWGVSWNTQFHDVEGRVYFWSGNFSRRDGLEGVASGDDDENPTADLFDGLEPKKPRLEHEILMCDGKPVFERWGDKFQLAGQDCLPAKLSPNETGFIILSEEDAVKPARLAISQMLYVDPGEDLDEPYRIYSPHGSISRHAKRYCNLKDIRDCRLPTHMKLALIYEHERDEFNDIVNGFKDVFPYIEDIKIERTNFGPFADVPVIQMKERGLPKYFSQDVLSSGMRRTLMHLARIALWPDGTLVLIDEFENSLGANCIDAVAQELIGIGKRLQFIITSHHPYIINALPMDRWKVIGRKQGRIENYTTSQLGIGASKHEAFLQLINTDVFKFGILPNEPVLSR